MVAAMFQKTIGTSFIHGCGDIFDSGHAFTSSSVGSISKAFSDSVVMLRNEPSTSHRLYASQESASHSFALHPLSGHLQCSRASSKQDSSETALTLLRHGESMWNVKNLFTGCIDVPLTAQGIEEAIEAGRRICDIPVDMIYTSALVRSQMTAMLAMTQHHCKKVPIIVHNDSKEAQARSLIYSEETIMQSIPVVTAWQLNERMYGELQGFNKQEMAEQCGKEQVHMWRRSYETSPPNGESLQVCAERAVAYFEAHIKPQLSSGKHILVTAHANSLRSIIMYLDNLTAQEVIDLELSTGVPMLYIYRDGKFIRRGSPLGHTYAGVYALSETLSLYKQNLEKMLHLAS